MAIRSLPDFRDPALCRRLVIKIGSALLVDGGGQVRADWLRSVVADIAALRAAGTTVVVVSSGAIAIGAKKLGLTHGGRRTLAEAQAAASVGQIELASVWASVLAERGLSRRIGLTVPSFLLAIPALAGSDLIALLPSRVAAATPGLEGQR